MKFKFQIELTVERVSGKFVSREEIGTQISGELENVVSYIDLDGLGADSDSEYEVTDSTVSEL